MTEGGPSSRDRSPGEPAPSSGVYAEINVLGTPTGLTISVAQGAALPAAPRGFVWRLVQTPPR